MVRPGTSPQPTSSTSTDGPWLLRTPGHTVRAWGYRTHPSDLEGDAMKDMFKSQAFRVVMILSALASSSLVLMAGRRWF